MNINTYGMQCTTLPNTKCNFWLHTSIECTGTLLCRMHSNWRHGMRFKSSCVKEMESTWIGDQSLDMQAIKSRSSFKLYQANPKLVKSCTKFTLSTKSKQNCIKFESKSRIFQFVFKFSKPFLKYVSSGQTSQQVKSGNHL